ALRTTCSAGCPQPLRLLPRRTGEDARQRRREPAAVVMIKTNTSVLVVTLTAIAALRVVPHAQQKAPPALKPTNHVRLPADPALYWLAPPPADERAAKTAAMAQFAEGVKLEVDMNFAKALPIFSQKSVQQGPLGDYALYYQGLAELRLGRSAEAKRTFESLAAKSPTGYLIEGAALRGAESAEALGDQQGAADIY